MLTDKEMILQELKVILEDPLPEVLDFTHFVKEKYAKARLELALLGERVLGRDWFTARGRRGRARFVKGDVVVVSFPFSDLSRAKRRPDLVVAELKGEDRILCQITSHAVHDQYSIILDNRDFESGGLKRESCIRPHRLFTADVQLMLYCTGHPQRKKLEGLISRLIGILKV